jgi:hypothetical protein
MALKQNINLSKKNPHNINTSIVIDDSVSMKDT